MVFFYGTLMRAFGQAPRLGLDRQLRYCGPGTIEAALYDLGRYPAAVPASGSRVRGELHEIGHPAALHALDAFEDYREDDPAASLYTRRLVPVTLDEGGVLDAFVYFFNGPLDGAIPIPSGDYLAYRRMR